ncbi:GNAT family N-acetyltransferase [Rheinheimera baltica]|uniref:GNAT family N-acetyltransferase n=1 Tax=Rheinheimera baltica TaxID=67576 RepID=UPI001F0A1522|nr:GNAT family N-acetyltransferase [Rheinheimera baltica]
MALKNNDDYTDAVVVCGGTRAEGGITMSNFTEDNSSEFADQAKQKIAEFNAQHWDASKRQALGLKQLNAFGELVAALAGRTFGNWFYLESFWLAETERGKGIGSAMLASAEAMAKARGCRFVVLDTVEFQAKPFYQRHGYQVKWVQQDYPFAGGAKYFMTKTL